MFYQIPIKEVRTLSKDEFLRKSFYENRGPLLGFDDVIQYLCYYNHQYLWDSNIREAIRLLESGSEGCLVSSLSDHMLMVDKINILLKTKFPLISLRVYTLKDSEKIARLEKAGV